MYQFTVNNDKRTCTMLHDNKVINDEIPYVPHKLVDHRGLYMYLHASRNKVSDKSFDTNVPNSHYVIESYRYMMNPYHVEEAIFEGRLRKK